MEIINNLNKLADANKKLRLLTDIDKDIQKEKLPFPKGINVIDRK